MSEPGPLLDTSTLSEVMRNRDQGVQHEARSYLDAHERFTFSILTRFEILRGLHAKSARRQIESFEALCSISSIVDLEDPIVVRASVLYGLLHSAGSLIDDVDLLIAATALELDVPVITENRRHFERIPNLQVESWRTP
ncbi:MAG: type II toxin-antitoxin system VapC family toxin [Acidobacteriota bacterium]